MSGETLGRYINTLQTPEICGRKFSLEIQNQNYSRMSSGVAGVTPDLLKVAPEFRYTLVIILNNLSFLADHSRMTW